MTENEIKNRIRQLLKSGVQISLGLPSASGEAKVVANLSPCSIPSHRCLACDGDKPETEFHSASGTICLHQVCFRLWNEVRHNPP